MTQKELEKYPSNFQPAGEKYALKYLDSFISLRGKNYNKHIKSGKFFIGLAF